MNLNGAVINFLGDSITEGHGTSSPGKVFHQLIKAEHSLKEAYNYGIGGTRIARNTSVSESTKWDLYFELRADVMQKNADAVVVFGGTNDYGHGDAHFGIEDSTDVYTFCGAVNSLIKKLKKDFPKSKIIFMTPLHRLGDANGSQPDNKNLEDYVNAIINICKKENIPVIDLFNINPIDPTDKVLIPDGLHPSDKGHIVMAKVIADELLKI